MQVEPGVAAALAVVFPVDMAFGQELQIFFAQKFSHFPTAPLLPELVSAPKR